MDDLQKAWIACAIDTEGSIIATPNNSLRITVGNICKEFCDHIQTITGIGTVGIHDKTRQHILYAWNLYNQSDIYLTLKASLPWMIVKKDRAETACKYIEMRMQHERPNIPHTEEELSLLNKLRIRKNATTL